jgi:hypothetical protein
MTKEKPGDITEGQINQSLIDQDKELQFHWRYNVMISKGL